MRHWLFLSAGLGQATHSSWVCRELPGTRHSHPKRTRNNLGVRNPHLLLLYPRNEVLRPLKRGQWEDVSSRMLETLLSRTDTNGPFAGALLHQGAVPRWASGGVSAPQQLWPGWVQHGKRNKFLSQREKVKLRTSLFQSGKPLCKQVHAPHSAPLPPCSQESVSSKQNYCSDPSVFTSGKEVSHPKYLGTRVSSATAPQPSLPVPLLSLPMWA